MEILEMIKNGMFQFTQINVPLQIFIFTEVSEQWFFPHNIN